MGFFKKDKKKEKKESGAYAFIQSLINSKKFKSSILIIFLVVFIGGYTVFFTSPLYMPTDTSDYRETELYAPNALDDEHVFTVVRWQYSETQDRMEVELDIENTAYDGMTDYRIVVRTDPSSRPTVTKVINDTSLMILQFDNIPGNFKIISLQISLPDNDENILRLYTNPDAVERVDTLEILSRTEYQINRLQRNISVYQEQIEQSNNEIAEREARITNIETQNQELNESRPYRTEAEIQEIDNQIKNNEARIESERDAIEELNAQILENQNRIKLTREQISKLQ